MNRKQMDTLAHSSRFVEPKKSHRIHHEESGCWCHKWPDSWDLGLANVHVLEVLWIVMGSSTCLLSVAQHVAEEAFHCI